MSVKNPQWINTFNHFILNSFLPDFFPHILKPLRNAQSLKLFHLQHIHHHQLDLRISADTAVVPIV